MLVLCVKYGCDGVDYVLSMTSLDLSFVAISAYTSVAATAEAIVSCKSDSLLSYLVNSLHFKD